MRVPSLVLLAACAGGAPAPAPLAHPGAPVTPPHVVDRHAAVRLRARGLELLHHDAPLDYERPFAAKPWDRGAALHLFHQACEEGDRYACIVEAEIVPQDADAASYRVVAANCRAGDLMSCRALPLDEHAPRFPEVPGAMSRRVACQNMHLPPPCDAAALQRECTAGFPAACVELGSSMALSPEQDALYARWPRLCQTGCVAGIARECQNVTDFGTAGDKHESAQRLCDLWPGYCDYLAEDYELRHDAAREREAMERSCEYGEKPWGGCAKLGGLYLEGKLEEPVPGRGQALVDWACPKLVPVLGKYLFNVQPACRRATSLGAPPSPAP